MKTSKFLDSNMNRIQEQDIYEFVECFNLSEQLAGATFMITGATGLIGSTLVHCLLALNKGVHVIAPVRNVAKAEKMYEKDELLNIHLMECDLLSFDYSKIEAVDYIVHCAAPTSSKSFVDFPVETFETVVLVTKCLLDYACGHKVKSFIYLSSLEVYGEIIDDSLYITEDMQGYLNPTSIRSSYPMAKRCAENLCCLYAAEYGVHAKIVRLTQTTGAGIAFDDNRIIAQFARLASKGEDIILHTTGESARPYCYVTDAISAILYVLLKGNDAEAYNVANETTYISAREMAEYLKSNFNSSINVRVELNDNMGYAPVCRHNLSSRKLRELGWRPRYGLDEIFKKLILYLNS